MNVVPKYSAIKNKSSQDIVNYGLAIYVLLCICHGTFVKIELEKGGKNMHVVNFFSFLVLLFYAVVIGAIIWYALSIHKKLTSIDKSLDDISRKLDRE